jgi:hypothetical protein
MLRDHIEVDVFGLGIEQIDALAVGEREDGGCAHGYILALRGRSQCAHSPRNHA